MWCNSEPTAVLATSNYGGNFVTALKKGNIFATQFHPEKSQENGLQLLKNFLKWDGKK
jgi:glutamine amidotransferase